MKVIDRQNKIMEIVRQKGTVSVNELTLLLNVSPATIRRDLEQLEQEHSLRRIFGGAIDSNKIGFEPSYLERLRDCPIEKKAIARAAASLIKPGEIVALDPGTTTTQVAHELVNTRPLTVITSSLAIGHIFAELDTEDITVIMPGGILRSKTYSLVGSACEDGIRNYRCDKAIIACHSLMVDRGAMNTNLLALGAKKALVSVSEKVIIAADHTKFKATGLATFAEIDEIDTIITDWQTPEPILNAFRQKGIEVIVAPKELGED